MRDPETNNITRAFFVEKNMKQETKQKFKTIGVLGGMGHCASAHFYQLLLMSAQEKLKAVQDDDYPQIIINSIALEGGTEHGMEKNVLILKQLINGLKTLEKAGADFLVIPCNSVHNSINELRKNVQIPILSIIEKVKKTVINSGCKKVLLLSSETTSKYNLYQDLLISGIQIVEPEVVLKKKVTKLILSVMGNKNINEFKKPVIDEINALYKSKKIDAVILGCTELPVAITQEDVKAKAFDSLKILADSGIIFSKGLKI